MPRGPGLEIFVIGAPNLGAWANPPESPRVGSLEVAYKEYELLRFLVTRPGSTLHHPRSCRHLVRHRRGRDCPSG